MTVSEVMQQNLINFFNSAHLSSLWNHVPVFQFDVWEYSQDFVCIMLVASDYLELLTMRSELPFKLHKMILYGH